MIIRRKTNNSPEKPLEEEKKIVSKEVEPQNVVEQFGDVDISLIEFKERAERRRGERRRGFRRIDERSLVSRAQEEAVNIRNNAKDDGYKEGIMTAKEEIQELKTSLSSFLNAKEEVLEVVSKDILELGVEVAKKIIKKEVTLDNEILASILQEVIDKVSHDEQKVTIKVNSDDLEYAQEVVPKFLNQARIDAKTAVVPDEEIEKGSCTLVVSNGVVDANFKTQIKLIENAFEIYK